MIRPVVNVVSVVVVILIAIVILQYWDGVSPFSKSNRVEITTTPGAKVFAKLPDGEEQFLNSVPESDDGMLSQVKIHVPIDADIILRYDNNEKIIAYEEWQEDKAISVDFHELISIYIGAEPWAYVYIKLPNGDDFIKPRTKDFIVPPEPIERKTNLTPIRGEGLKVPIGTAIKLVYQDKEKVFSYEEWKRESRISHNFSNP